MRSTFYGFEIARNGLNVAQAALNITGHNMGNVDTPGYTRQRLNQTAIAPFSGNTFFAPQVRALSGQGALGVSIDQIRDVYLDRQIREKSPAYFYADARLLEMDFIQNMIGEADGKGPLSGALGNFASSWQELPTKSDNISIRTAIRESARTLCETLNDYYNKLADEQVKQNEMIEVAANRVNRILDGIAQLNDEIYKFETYNGNANDLRDQRNVLLDELAQYIDFDYKELPRGVGDNPTMGCKVEITVKDPLNNTIKLIDGTKKSTDTSTVTHLEVYGTGDLLADGVTEAYGLKYTNQGNLSSTPPTMGFWAQPSLQGGVIKAYFDLRDGNGEIMDRTDASNVQYGIPYVLNQLNAFATTLIRELNTQHMAGHTLEVNGAASQPGSHFFVTDNKTSGAGAAARDIRLSDAIISNVGYIAVSSEPVVAGNTGNGLNAQNIIDKVFHSKTLSFAVNSVTGGGTPSTESLDSFLRGFFSIMGTKVNQLESAQKLEFTTYSTQIEQREAISGVNTDEEATNLIRFQRSYQAAARAFTAMDEALDILINRTGLVGR